MSNLIFHQLFERETSSYTYLLADEKTKEAIIIDPVVEMADRDEKLIKELGLYLKFVLDTHVHADHITASGELRKRLGAKVAISEAYGMTCPDILLKDGETLEFGSYSIKAISTPGHTAGCMSYVVEDMVFTGDALLVRGCGRTDFQEGSAENLFSSVREKLFELPENYTVYPAHDYKGFTRSSIKCEKNHNPRLNLNVDQSRFVEIMHNLNLAYPKKIQEAVPANKWCGMPVTSEGLNSGYYGGIPTVTAEELEKKIGHVKIVDVRQSEEFNGELGHIGAAELATLGDNLIERLERGNKDEEIVFVCRIGARSATATELALSKGYKRVYNLYGGMTRWNQLGYAIERDMGGS